MNAQPGSLLSLLNDLGALVGGPPVPRIERVGRPIGLSEQTLKEAEQMRRELGDKWKEDGDE